MMLYRAAAERILKRGYQVKYVSVPAPGGRSKYVPVYVSESGEEVFEDEATNQGVVFIQRPNPNPLRSEREQEISGLIDVLFGKLPVVDWDTLTDAITAMALEADLKLNVGSRLATKLVADEFYHDYPQTEYVISLLVGLALKGAIVPLTSLLAFQASWDHTENEKPVHDLARTTLREFIAGNPDFQCEAARAALDLYSRLGWSESQHYQDPSSRGRSKCFPIWQARHVRTGRETN